MLAAAPGGPCRGDKQACRLNHRQTEHFEHLAPVTSTPARMGTPHACSHCWRARIDQAAHGCVANSTESKQSCIRPQRARGRLTAAKTDVSRIRCAGTGCGVAEGRTPRSLQARLSPGSPACFTPASGSLLPSITTTICRAPPLRKVGCHRRRRRTLCRPSGFYVCTGRLPETFIAGVCNVSRASAVHSRIALYMRCRTHHAAQPTWRRPRRCC